MIMEPEAKYVDHARTELQKQRQRHIYFSNSPIFGDPAWEFVLEAYIAASDNRCVALSDLDRVLHRPATFIVRLARILEDEGFVERCRFHKHHDLKCVQITDAAASWCEQGLGLKSDGGNFQNN